MAAPTFDPGRGRRPLPAAALRWLAIAVGVLLLLAAAGVAVAMAVSNTDWARRKAASIASAKLDRKVELGGLKVDWRLPLRIHLKDLRVANAPWASQPRMAQIGEASFEVRLLPLLLGRGLVLPTLDLRAPRVFLERDGERNNWTFGRPPAREKPEDGKTSMPRVDRLSIDDGQIQFLEPSRRTDLKITGKPQGEGLALAVSGNFGGEPVQLTARTGGIAGLFGEQPYPIDIEGRFGATRLKAQGQVLDPRTLARLDLQLEASGAGAADIGKPFGVAIPDTPPYRIAGRLLKNGAVWKYDGFKGRLGDSDIAGFVQFDPRGAGRRPLLTGSLASDKLDFNDLGPLIGLPGGTGPGQTASPRQRRLAAQRRARGEALPAQPFDASKWRRLDAQVEFIARRVLNAPSVPVSRLQGTLALEDGVLQLQPLKVAVAGGTIEGKVQIDGREAPPKARVDASLAGVRLDRLLPKVQALKGSFGAVYGQVDLRSSGLSVKSLLGEADGTMRLAMNGGRISNLMIEAAGLDGGEVLKFLAGGDRTVRLRCAIAAFDVKAGVAQSKAFLIDTDDSAIFGDGNIDFAREELGLVFAVEPKDRSVLSLRTPIHVTGPFVQPRIRPEAGPLVVRGLSALALAAINPLLALLPTIEPGPGKDANCAGVLQRYPASEAAPPSPSAADVPQRAPAAARAAGVAFSR